MNRWIFFVALFSFAASARTFQNSYIRFDLPDQWRCGQEGVAWVCVPGNVNDSREALVIATAKLTGPEDTLNAFANHLRKPKTLISNAKTSLSQPISLDRRKINGQDWVQAVHMGSEVPEFRTKYLATVKGKLAVLVSLSADRESEGKYDRIFENAIRTIQVDSTKPVLAQNPAAPPNPGGSVIGKSMGGQAPAPAAAAETAPAKKIRWMEIGLLAVGGIAALLIIRKLV